jgi:hypothetical protein
MALATVLLATVFATRASAQCGYLEGTTAPASFEPPAWSGPAPTGPALVLVSAHDHESNEDTIVGFWKVTFVAKGNADIPDGTVIDFGFAQWHDDGTEILNSSRPPATSSFCLGVWKKSSEPSRYRLNHFALSSDLSGNMIGPANIREDVTLGRGGNTYGGGFTIDQFDLAGNLLVHVSGRVTATRITVDTPGPGA